MQFSATYPPIVGQVLIPLPPQTNTTRRPVRHNSIIPTFKNDVASATRREHLLATKIAAAWRGYVLRRYLRTRNITLEFQHAKATMIQCFVRRIFAKSKAQAMRVAREDMVVGRLTQYQIQHLKEFAASVNWQRSQFEGAATTVQRTFRWYMQRKQGLSTFEDCPIKSRKEHKRYLPEHWRRHHASMPEDDLGVHMHGTPRAGDNMLIPVPPPRSDAGHITSPNVKSRGGDSMALMLTQQHQSNNGHSLAVALRSPQPPKHRFSGPPTQEVVEAINDNRRRRQRELRQVLESEDQLKRKQQLEQGIVAQDFEACAAMVQRRFRKTQALQELHSRQCLKEYYDRYATIIQCAFRSHVARKTASKIRKDIESDIWLATRKYGIAQVERLKTDFVWNASIMIRASVIIQSAFRRHRYLKAFNPNGGVPWCDYIATGPKKLPLGLFREHRTAVQPVRMDDEDRRPKFVFRRHRDPVARQALAEIRRQEAHERRLAQESSHPTAAPVVAASATDVTANEPNNQEEESASAPAAAAAAPEANAPTSEPLPTADHSSEHVTQKDSTDVAPQPVPTDKASMIDQNQSHVAADRPTHAADQLEPVPDLPADTK